MRILKISKKYNKRPSEILGITNDPYLAFCFDEACEFILSMRTTEIVEENGKRYVAEKWIKEPNWIDKKIQKPKNNMELFNQMKKNLEKFNKGVK